MKSVLCSPKAGPKLPDSRFRACEARSHLCDREASCVPTRLRQSGHEEENPRRDDEPQNHLGATRWDERRMVQRLVQRAACSVQRAEILAACYQMLNSRTHPSTVFIFLNTEKLQLGE